MRFGILGPLEVWDDDRQLALGGPQQRALLAVLLLHANRVVAVERLVDQLWGSRPPATARSLLQGCVAGLRRALRSRAEPEWRPLLTRAPGYLLQVRPGELDAERVEELVAEAAEAGSTGTEAGLACASDLLSEALSLWRGPVLGDIVLAAGGGESTRWEERRLAVLEQRIDLDLRLGRHARLIGELQVQVQDHPLREGLWRQLMLALFRADRQAEALAAYRRLRQTLVEELGVEPDPSVQQVHRSILAGERASDAGPPPSVLVAASRRTVPAQLPGAIAGFTGREEHLKLLDELFADPAGGTPIGVVSGTAGVGKTTLVVHWAHRNRERFDDGQLYVNLRGFDPVRPPMAPAEAVRGFLDALRVPPDRIPVSLDAQAGLYRSLLAERKMLVVLDNAREAAQVRPLLPGAGGSMVVVTSRNQLSSLVAADGACPVGLDLLSHAEARQLLVRRIGAGRTAAEPEATEEIIARCARLPLALAVVAARAATRPQHPLSALVQELRGAHTGLDAWSDPDPTLDVRAAFDVSYHTLATESAQLFRYLGLSPGPDVDAYAAAALVDTTRARARRLLDQLLDAHLLEEPDPGRYTLHDLLRAYAARADRGRTDSEPDRRAALTRLLDHYRHTASVAMDAAYPYERERRPVVPSAPLPTPDLSDPSSAIAWLDTELPNLLAAAGRAAEHGWPEHAWHLSASLHLHLRTRGRNRDAENLHHQALIVARTSRDRAGELATLIRLGDIHRLRGRNEQALDDFGQALAIARTMGDRSGELDALAGLCNVHLQQGRHGQAADVFRQALEMARTIGHRGGELDALAGLSDIHRVHGQYDQAADYCEHMLEIARAIGHRTAELNALRGLGHLHRLQGQHERAIDDFVQALETARATGHPAGELGALAGLGDVHRLDGRYKEAAGWYQQAFEIAQGIDNRNWMFEALYGLGRLHHATGHPDAALAHHERALDLATDLAQPADQARAHDGAAHAQRTLNQPEQARQHWQHALDILTSLDTDHTEDGEASVSTIRANLASLDQPPE